jgi:hypothetical protein
MNLRFKTKAEILRLQLQWETFERIENHDDVIYQRIQNGLRDQMFYQFRDAIEFKNYKAGQELHVLQNPTLPPSTFSPVRDRPFPTTPSTTALPYTTQVNKFIVSKAPISSDEYTQIRSDAEIYMYVSSYNHARVYKYNFTSDDEKLAYERGERRALGIL